MIHVTYECVTYYVNMSLYIGMIRVTYVRHHVWMSHVTYEGVMSRMCDVTYSYVKWFIHMWHDSFIRDMTHSDVTRLTHMWHDSFIRDMTDSYVWHDSSICDVIHSYVTWLIHMWHDPFICDMTHSYVTYVTWFIHTCDMTDFCVIFLIHIRNDATYTTWPIHMYDMAHTYVWYGSFICLAWLTHMWYSDMMRCIQHDPFICVTWLNSFLCVTWLIHMCDMAHSYVWHGSTHSYVWHDSFICVTWLIHMCDMTHWYVWHDSFICVTWLIHMCDMAHATNMCDITHSCSWHDWFICDMTHHMNDMTHSYVWHGSFTCETWLIYVCDTTHSTSIGMCMQATCTGGKMQYRMEKFIFQKMQDKTEEPRVQMHVYRHKTAQTSRRTFVYR